MKKIFINIIVLDILLLILAGCQNSPKNETAQYASGNNNVEDNKKNIPEAKWQPRDLFRDKKEKKKKRKKKSKDSGYYYAVMYDGEYYSMSCDMNILEPDQMLGTVQSIVTDGKKPQKNLEANWSSAIGTEIYLFDSDKDSIYLKEPDTVNGEIKDVYRRYEKGLIKEDDLPVGAYPDGVNYDGNYYIITEEIEEIPSDSRYLGIVKQIGYLLESEELGGNTIHQLGAKVYLGSDNKNTILYLEQIDESGEKSYHKLIDEDSYWTW